MQNGYPLTNNWVIEETKTANLGDVRLNYRLGNILEMLSRKPPESIPAAAKSWAEIKSCLALYMIIAWRILSMTMLGRSCPDMPCTAIFDEEEWHAVYRVIHRSPPPKIPPSLNTMIRMIASLGGFLGRKSDGHPGTQTIWIGLQRTKDFVMAMEALNASRG